MNTRTPRLPQPFRILAAGLAALALLAAPAAGTADDTAADPLRRPTPPD